MIEHMLTSHYDIAFGAGLAVVNPAGVCFAA
jgi:alcohol dehydrogenase YqhD (iron-dependent ADH family)